MYHFIDDLSDGKRIRQYDDILPRLRLFAQFGAPVTLVTLDYLPMRWQELYKHRLFDFAEVNMFNVLQDAVNLPERVMTLSELQWPAEAIIFPSRGVGQVFLHGQLIAKAFTDIYQHGRIDRVELFDENQHRTTEYMYDARGFLSSARYYNVTNDITLQEFFAPDGRLRIRRFPEAGKDVWELEEPIYGQARFESLRELETHFLRDYIGQQAPTDWFLFAGTLRLHNIYLGTGWGKTKQAVMSVTELWGRPTLDNPSLEFQLTENYRHVVVNADNLADFLRERLHEHDVPLDPEIMPVWPVGSTPGRSMSFKEEIVLWALNGLSDEELTIVYDEILSLMGRFPAMALYLVGDQRVNRVNDWLKRDLADAYKFPRKGGYLEGKAEQEGVRKPRVRVFQDASEQDIPNLVNDARMVVDLGRIPSDFLNVQAISRQIPQFNRVASRYLVPGDTGEVVEDLGQLQSIMAPYLHNLPRWSAVRLATRDLGTQYYSRPTFERWMRLLTDKGD
jgi:accessory Sec system protein Asp1